MSQSCGRNMGVRGSEGPFLPIMPGFLSFAPLASSWWWWKRLPETMMGLWWLRSLSFQSLMVIPIHPQTKALTLRVLWIKFPVPVRGIVGCADRYYPSCFHTTSVVIISLPSRYCGPVSITKCVYLSVWGAAPPGIPITRTRSDGFQAG